SCADVEKTGVPEIDVVERAPRLDVVGAGEKLRAEPRREQLFIREETDGLPAGAEIFPELLDIPCAGKPSGHADDCDRLRLGGGGRRAPPSLRRFERAIGGEARSQVFR